MKISPYIGFVLSVLAAAVGATPTDDADSTLDKRTSYEEYLILVGEYCYIFRNQAIIIVEGIMGVSATRVLILLPAASTASVGQTRRVCKLWKNFVAVRITLFE